MIDKLIILGNVGHYGVVSIVGNETVKDGLPKIYYINSSDLVNLAVSGIQSSTVAIILTFNCSRSG